MSSEISLAEVIRARQVIYRYLKPTPLTYYQQLSDIVGFRAYIKHENHNPTGSFKIRGGINLIGSLPEEERRRGVITATRGNHGQSIALASKIFDVQCVVVVPYGNNPEKNDAMRSFGAELIEHGNDFDEARLEVERLQHERGLRYVHSANEPKLINGVGTYALEIFEELPDVDAIIVPIGGGSGVSGVITVAKAINPRVKIIGVQPENASVVYLSWKKGEKVTLDKANTFADGLATRFVFDLTFDILKTSIDDMVTVSEEELKQSIKLLLRTTHNLAEGAGAAALAAAIKLKDRLRAQKVVMILSGGNIDIKTLKWILET